MNEGVHPDDLGVSLVRLISRCIFFLRSMAGWTGGKSEVDARGSVNMWVPRKGGEGGFVEFLDNLFKIDITL